ncbi:unnamed protein product [Ceutorhynchus assimilis]|uniref:Protein THEM6 n=1 Tax=Ceutorhynchus assimilis TaxID=467358 RepID=A0A9N9MLG2_9CUCU|nr:unnamed protein product [Ceutorhynchus assimilis]
MFDVCVFILSVISVVLFVYFLLEFHYFFRAFLCMVNARFFKGNVFVLDETFVNGICLTNDVDNLLNHMNNARYLRELDFARIDFYERTKLYERTVAKGGSVFIGASTIRYRRFIKIFSKYCISTKIVYWDNQNVYLEHKFITHKNFVNAISLCKLRFVKVDVEELMQNLMETLPKNVEGCVRQKPLKPLELEKWIESNQISSENLLKNVQKTDFFVA